MLLFLTFWRKEGNNNVRTAEEIEIIVTAKVTEVIQEIRKLLPTIQQEMGKIQQEVDKVDFNGITKRVKSSRIEKEVKKVVKKIKDEIKKYNTNEDGSKVIWVGTDNNPELIVSTKSIVAIKVVWDVERSLGEY